ncbi:CcmD family protein [Algoriphagus sp.]|uniref:CcmD family protein n=1 Tax=Algoriphagus sp. TaxID=1872435 RepID=UPI00262DAC67|nr:CcmD family protein [Algoriphagus sp.]
MKKLALVFLLVFSLQAIAQDKIEVTESDYSNNQIEMADKMREDGKIYVLVGIIGIIFIGITGYLVYTERKISKIEKSLPAN